MTRSIFLVLFLFCQTTAVMAQALSPQDQRIIDAVEANANDQLAFLEKTVNQNSGTNNLVGVRAAGRMYDEAFSALGFDTQWIDMPADMKRAGHFYATRSWGEGPHILLIGHIDTVFEPESPFQRFEVEGEVARGPGIADMKGGNAVLLYAMAALMDAGAMDRGTITVFLTGDEEAVGNPISVARRDLIKAGKAADIALNFEGGSPDTMVIGRRGSSNWALEVTGQQAHSSGIFRDDVGAGAIFELARILNRFYGEVRGPFGLTFNPGTVIGGTAVSPVEGSDNLQVYGKGNIVAQTASTGGGLRFMNEEQKEQARDRMRGIVEDHLPQTSAVITFEDRYPAMEETDANRALLGQLNAVHARLGIEPVAAYPPERRGAADISFVAPYVTSMDGLGVFGDGAHSPREDMELPSLTFATKRAALFINDLLSDSD